MAYNSSSAPPLFWPGLAKRLHAIFLARAARFWPSKGAMEEAPVAKCSCQHCGVHLEFPRTAAGAEIDCPQCGQKTVLTLPEDYDPALAEGGPEGSGALPDC